MEEQKLDNKRKTILIIIAVLTLTIGVSLAYIIASLQDEARGNASVVSDTVDILRFEVDKDITLNPTQFNVTEGGENLSDTSVGSAILRANSTNDNATYNYYVYFQINSNDYIYTTTEQTPEIVLTITDPEGNPVTNISGLDYVTSGGVSGFDITTKTGLYEVAELYEIISTSSSNDTIQEWEFTVSFINLDTNQAENGGKTLEAEIILSRKPVYTLASYITDELYTGVDGENGLYYHDGTGTYGTLEAGDNSYRFAGGDYEIAEAYQGTYNQIYGEIIKRYCDEVDGVEDTTFLESCSGNLYYTLVYDGNNTQYTTINNALEQAVTDGYLTDDNIKNYVCFGTNETPCPEENLYRVLGVYDEKIKLIKANYATSAELGTNGDYYNGSNSFVSRFLSRFPYRGNTDLATYYWNYTNYGLAYEETGYGNVWSYSELNKTNLNINYLNYLGTTWSNLIEEETWYVGGVDGSTVNPTSGIFAKQFYEAELGEGKVTTAPFEPYQAKIGLMYVSEYLYSANPEYWGTVDYSSMETEVSKWFTENWLDIGLMDWTVSRVSRRSGNSNSAWCVNLGVVVDCSAVVSNDLGVRPSFYISSSTLYSSGDGSKENPIRIQNSFINFNINGIHCGVKENTTWKKFINSSDNIYNISINESGNVINSSGYEILLDGNTVSGADIIVNNGNYNTGLITFTIEEVEYRAYNGMTWEEYVNSEYNSLNFVISPYNGIVYYPKDYDYKIVDENHEFIYGDDIIIQENKYYLAGVG